MHSLTNNRSRLRILHVIDTLAIGGAENYVVNLVNSLDKTKFEVWIAYTDGRVQGVNGEALLAKLDKNVNLVKWNPKKIGSLRSLYYFYYNIYHIISLWKIMQLYHIDLVHTHQPFSAFRAWIAAKVAGIPVVHNHMTVITPQRKTEWLLVQNKKFSKLFNNLVFKYVAFSDFLKKDLVTKLQVSDDKIELIYLGIGLEQYRISQENMNIKAEFHLDEQTPVVGVVARLYPEKGVYKIIRAFPYVVKKRSDACLLIVGDGPCRNQLQDMCKSLDISKNVIFTGARLDVPRLMGMIDIYLQTTDRPNLGLSVLEAMAMGKPIIAVAQDEAEREMASETVIDGVNGFIVPNIPEEIASKIIWLIEDKEYRNRMGKSSREIAEKKFDLKNHVLKVEALYENIMREYNKSSKALK